MTVCSGRRRYITMLVVGRLSASNELCLVATAQRSLSRMNFTRYITHCHQLISTNIAISAIVSLSHAFTLTRTVNRPYN